MNFPIFSFPYFRQTLLFRLLNIIPIVFKIRNLFYLWLNLILTSFYKHNIPTRHYNLFVSFPIFYFSLFKYLVKLKPSDPLFLLKFNVIILYISWLRWVLQETSICTKSLCEFCVTFISMLYHGEYPKLAYYNIGSILLCCCYCCSMWMYK